MVGCLAALGLQDLPKEERLKFLSNLIKENDLEKLHNELHKLAERGGQVLSQFFKEGHKYEKTNDEKKKITELFTKSESREAYDVPDNKNRKSKHWLEDINFISSLFIILVFIGISYFLFSKEGFFLTVINSIGSNLLNLLFFGIFIIFVFILYTFLKRKSYLMFKNKRNKN